MEGRDTHKAPSLFYSMTFDDIHEPRDLRRGTMLRLPMQKKISLVDHIKLNFMGNMLENF